VEFIESATVLPSHEAIVISDQKEAETCQRCHGGEEESAFEDHD
jgi:hypothetical protein